MKKTALIALILSVILIFTGCSSAKGGGETESKSESESSSSTGKTAEEKDLYSNFDLSEEWDNTAVTVKLNGSGATVSGSGAKDEDGSLRITSAGTYVLSGSLDGGQIIVSCGDSDNVKLVLNGVSVTSDSGAAILVENADKLLITLAPGTENELSDSAERAEDAEDTACVYSHDDLTINGSGSLTVNGNCKNGIAGNDDVKIVNGDITVKAVNNAVKGKDSLYIKDGVLSVVTGEGSGSVESRSEDFGGGNKGGFKGGFRGGEGEMPEMPDGEAPAAPGKGSIERGEGSEGFGMTPPENGEDMPDMRGGENRRGSGEEQTGDGSVVTPLANKAGEGEDAVTGASVPTSGSSSETASETGGKGLVSDGEILIQGGKLTFDTADDSIHSNGTVTIEGGEISVSSGDDGIHADTSVTISGGKIDVAKSYEGIEAEHITVSGGDISIVSADDGLNAAGGNDSSAETRTGGFDFGNKVGEITISGGYIFIDSTGDGVDSNGTIDMSSGTVVVYGPVNSANGALDYEKSFSLTGGTLLALGARGMAQGVSDSSLPQVSINADVKAGETFTLCGKDGSVLFTVTPTKAAQNVIFVSDSLKSGESYSCVSGGTVKTEAVNGAAFEGTVSGGTESGKVTAK